MSFSPLLFAQAAGGPSAMTGMLLPLGIFVIMYFLMIRPQQKQLKQHKALLSSLKKGDEVVTQGGMFGRIHAITDNQVVIEVSAGVRVRVLKQSIQGKAAVEEAVLVSAKSEEKKEEKQ